MAGDPIKEEAPPVPFIHFNYNVHKTPGRAKQHIMGLFFNINFLMDHI